MDHINNVVKIVNFGHFLNLKITSAYKRVDLYASIYGKSHAYLQCCFCASKNQAHKQWKIVKDETRLFCQQSMIKGKVEEITVKQLCPASKLVTGSVLSGELDVKLRARNNNRSNSVSRNMVIMKSRL